MSGFLDGIGKVIGKIADNVQGRTERLKNEKDKLNNEKESILSRKPLSARDADRLLKIDERVAEIKSILGNNAKD